MVRARGDSKSDQLTQRITIIVGENMPLWKVSLNILTRKKKKRSYLVTISLKRCNDRPHFGKIVITFPVAIC